MIRMHSIAFIVTVLASGSGDDGPPGLRELFSCSLCNGLLAKSLFALSKTFL